MFGTCPFFPYVGLDKKDFMGGTGGRFHPVWGGIRLCGGKSFIAEGEVGISSLSLLLLSSSSPPLSMANASCLPMAIKNNSNNANGSCCCGVLWLYVLFVILNDDDDNNN